MSDNNNDDYVPISCDRHSEFELAIMRKQKLRVGWRDPQGSMHLEVLLPQDMMTQNGAEYMIAQSVDGHSYQLRLDYIIQTNILKK